MKPYLRHITAFSLSALVLFSTLSFSVDLHYCGKKLVAVALNDKAHGCGMDVASEIPSPADSRIGMHCCEDVMLAFEGQEDLQQSVQEVSFVKIFATAEPRYFSIAAPLEVFRRTFHFREYSPPLLIRDIPLLNQTFLI